MILHTIKLKVQKTPTATAQPYSGPQIIKVLGITTGVDFVLMHVWADETKTQECNQYVQRADQPFDPKERSPGGEPIDQSNCPVMLKDTEGKVLFVTSAGTVVVSSYCFVAA